MLCNATDSTSRCARGCEQEISKRDASMRGYGSESKRYLMTQGPLKRRDTSKEDALQGMKGAVGMISFLIDSETLPSL